MRRHRLISSFAIALGLGLLGMPVLEADDAAGQGEAPAGISVTVAVAPMDAARTQFRCTATIADLRDGSVLMAPSIQLLAGREGSARSAPGAGVGILFQVRVAEGGTEASYAVEHSRNGTVVAKQSGSISLTPAAAPRD
jgi:hypothetical protein